MTRPLMLLAMCVSASIASAQSAAVRSPVQKARVAVATANARLANATKDSATAAKPGKDSAAATSVRAGTPPVETDSSLSITREVFSYEGVGRRDPFFSLMLTSELRPTLNELRVSLIAYDNTDARNSVAFLVDQTTKDEYRARVGDRLGRLRVAAINVKSIVFDVNEFGFQRRETLLLNDSTKVRR